MNGKIMFTAGVIGGAIVGVAVGAALDPMKDKDSARIRKRTSRAFRTIGQVVDGIIDLRR